MPHRVSPTDRIRGHIDELFAQDKALPEILEEVARLGAQLLMQAALEAEITEFLGRDRYQRPAACEDARPGSRNGYREVTVKTTAGPVTLARPDATPLFSPGLLSCPPAASSKIIPCISREDTSSRLPTAPSGRIVAANATRRSGPGPAGVIQYLTVRSDLRGSRSWQTPQHSIRRRPWLPSRTSCDHL